MNLAAAIGVLTSAGVASPRFDAESLAAHVRGVRRGVPGELTPAQERVFDRLIQCRADREPLQHLIGSVGFRYLEILVGPGVFVPRPETESVVQAALDLAPARVDHGVVAAFQSTSGHPPMIDFLAVDLCAGSGAIALSLAQERPDFTVHAVEADPAAYAWLTRNITATQLPVTSHLADAVTALPELDGTVDVVISNPPYVPPGTALDRETQEHDPALAIWGRGEDGLEVPRAVMARAVRLLKPGGLFVMEHDDTQGETAAVAARAAGFTAVQDHRDLAGRDRYLTARR